MNRHYRKSLGGKDCAAHWVLQMGVQLAEKQWEKRQKNKIQVTRSCQWGPDPYPRSNAACLYKAGDKSRVRGSQRTSHPLKKAAAASSTTFRSIEVLNIKCCTATRQSKADVNREKSIQKWHFRAGYWARALIKLSCRCTRCVFFFLIRDCVSGLASAPVKPTAPVRCQRVTRDSGVRWPTRAEVTHFLWPHFFFVPLLFWVNLFLKWTPQLWIHTYSPTVSSGRRSTMKWFVEKKLDNDNN